MITTPAPERGAGADDPTGPRLWQDRPAGYLWQGSVRTSFSNGRRIDSCDDSQRCLCGSSRSCRSRSSSSTVPMALCGAAAAAGANGGRNYGPQRGLAPDRMRLCRTRTGRQRVCGKAQSRWIDCCSSSTVAIECVVRVLSISCTCAKVTPEKQQTASRASELEVWR